MAHLRYHFNKNNAAYVSLIETISGFVFSGRLKQIPSRKVNLITKLWKHQDITRQKVVTDIIKLDKRGAGDASDVGAGKTLTALSIMASVYNHHYGKDSIYGGFLVMLPTTYLYKTWDG